MHKIAFIGLGNMGAPMALNLLKAGFALRVFDVSAGPLQRLAEAGAEIAERPADAVADADAVITMLPAGEHVQRLYLGADGVLAAIPAGALLIDCSTIAAATAREVAFAAATRGLTMIDAPVSGGTAGAAGAAAGTLTFIVGGTADAFERARPLLGAMGRNLFHAGGNGAGQVAKICNNMLLGIQMIGTIEALQLGVASGVDATVLSDIMARSSGRNWTLEVYNPWPGVMDGVPAARGYSGGFGSDLMLKDLGLAAEAAAAVRAPIALGALARELYRLHSAAGHGALDFSSLREVPAG